MGMTLAETATLMAAEAPIPNGCFYKDYREDLYFLWIIDGKIPKGSVAIPFGKSNTEEKHFNELTTRRLQFVHAVISPKDGIDPTKLRFQQYSDFQKVNFHVDFRESVTLTRQDMSPITTTDIMMEGSHLLTDLIEKHMKIYKGLK